MARRERLVFLFLAFATLLIVGRLVTGGFHFVLRDFWFSSGLVLLILLSVIDQPHFSKDANVFVNGVSGLISLVSVAPGARDPFWYVFLGWSGYLVLSSAVLMMVRTARLGREPRVVATVSRVNRQVGRPEALFSAFFLWGVIAQFSAKAAAFRILALYWSVFMILNLPAVSGAIGELFTRRSRGAPIRGSVRSFVSPRVAQCSIPPEAPSLSPGDMIDIEVPSAGVAATGRVVDDRVLSGIRIATVAIVATGPGWPSVARETYREGGLAVTIRAPNAGGVQDIPAGFVSTGSNIGALHFPVNPDVDLVEGEVLAVDFPGKRAYYQVVSATLKQLDLPGDLHLHDVDVVASQIGLWRPDKCRFQPVSWVAPAGGLVLRVRSSAPLAGNVPTGNLELGKVPNSSFPVHVCLDDIVTHNTAILGVTGSGKSYLAFSLIEGLLGAEIRVLVLDISRQHWVFLTKNKPYQLKDPGEVKKWLASDQKLAVHQFASSTNYPQTTSEIVQNAMECLEKSVKLRAGKNEPARLCVVFEEAHSLIPEWNQVSQRGDEQHVNRTARTVLQGRKYGMGCVVISQRTANVTKTILNQCNTIVALQSFDQTGLDFLNNYMGSAYANVISTLPLHHAVLVGKASSSTRPILFAIEDMSSRWVDDADGIPDAAHGPSSL